MNTSEFERLVEKALDELPHNFREKLDNIGIVIEDSPAMYQVKKLGLGSRGRLLGLYQGVPLKRRSHYYGMVMPDKITLFKGNIEDHCKSSGANIYDEVKHVLQHEIAHHFGITDKRLRDLDVY